MPSRSLDYRDIASSFDERYDTDSLQDVARALHEVAESVHAMSILEVGCGTGHWLAELASHTPTICGLDYSHPMLQQASQQEGSFRLTRGRAGQLPFRSGSFDLVFCVNAIHQFDQQKTFIQEAARLLRSGGVLAVVGMDPRDPEHNWYLHNYFDTTLRDDLERFPSRSDLEAWVDTAGLVVEWQAIEPIQETMVGREVLEAPFLRKHACSQLAALSDKDYQRGLQAIENALERAEKAGEELVFITNLRLAMFVGRMEKEG